MILVRVLNVLTLGMTIGAVMGIVKAFIIINKNS